MTTVSVVPHLVRKDLYLSRWITVGSTAAGAVSLALTPLSEMMFYVGTVGFICILVVLNIFIVMNAVAQEKKEKVLLFVLSLPISTAQYTVAKIIAGIIAFGLPWLILTTLSVAIIAFSAIPDGLVPPTIAVAGYLLLYYCVLFAVALVGDAVGPMSGVIIGGNISINLLVPVIFRLPSVRGNTGGPVAVWGPDIVAFILIELAIAALALAFAYVRQSRRTDFI